MRFTLALVAALALLSPATTRAANALNWDAKQDRVTADIKSGDLVQVLEKIASTAGWHVYLEPSATTHAVSAKFKDLAPGEALHMLLGDLNFAMVPQTNGPSRLYVFRTAMRNATQMIRPAKPMEMAEGKVIPNELIVRLKPGAKIEDLARLLGAKVVGRIDSLNAYRLQFSDAAATDLARTQLNASPEVTSVENNFSLEPPPSARQAQPGSSLPPPPSLQVKPPPENGRVMVGLVDTAVQSLGNGLDGFLLKQVSVAGDSQLDPNSPSHGTSMAETMLRSLQSISKGSSSVEILPVDVYGPNANTSTFDVANGIVTAINKGARIINLSLGSDSDSAFLHGVIQDASGKNILFIGAAGNTPVTTPFYPAAYPEVNAVTAIDQGQLASYANRGSFVSLGAPGTSVVYFNGQPYYVTGTSASAAFISGLASGYMESTGKGTASAQAFIQSNFGLKITPAK